MIKIMKYQFEEYLVHRITYQFLQDKKVLSVEPIYTGHINKTFRIVTDAPDDTREYLLQNLNTHVFTRPDAVMHNIVRCANFLHTECPEYPYEILTPMASVEDGSYLIQDDGLAWRMFEYVSDSRSQDVVSSADEAHKIGEAFGVFLSFVNRDSTKNYKVTISHFHDFTRRYHSFHQFLKDHGEVKDERCKYLIAEIERNASEYLEMETLKFPLRIIHHDTKVNNVLLDRQSGQVKCIIDLDTLMPGYIFSDLGDLMRTLLNPYDEDNFPENGKIMDDAVVSSLLDGFLNPIDQILTNDEKEYLIQGAKKITLLQILRFLEDHLKGDIYYQVKYPGHNLDRALSQLYLYHGMNNCELLNTPIVNN